MNKSKPKKKEMQPKKETQVMSPLMAGIKMTGNEIYAVTAQNVQIGANAELFDVVVKDIIVSPDALLQGFSNLNDLVEGPVSELIRAYATARGYTTSVTYAKVSEYVYQSLELLMILFHMFRAQNVRRVTTPSGLDIGGILAMRPSVQYSTSAVADYVINGTSAATATNHVNDGDVVISNAAWSKDWLSQLTHIKLSQPMVQWAAAHFAVFYNMNNQGGNAIISFIPNTLTNSSGIAAKTRFDALAASLESLRSSDADLIDILNFLGFTNDSVINLDFTRDARQQTLPLVTDANLESTFVNTNLYGQASNDDDVSEYFFDINGIFDALTYPDDAQLSADVVFSSRYLRGAVFTHYVFKAISVGSGVRIDPFYPFALSLVMADYPSPTQAVADRLRNVLGKWYASSLPKMPYTPESNIFDFSGTPAIAGSTTVTFYVASQSNVYKLPDTYDFYQSAKLAELIMGNVEYRQQLQSLANSIRTSSITKQS